MYVINLTECMIRYRMIHIETCSKESSIMRTTHQKNRKTPHPNDQFDPEKARAIRERDVYDPRNILDKYKGQSTEFVKQNRPRAGLVAILSNNIRDFNWGSVVRSACCLGVDEVVFTVSRKYDRRGSVGAHHYMDIDYIQDTKEAIEKYRNMGYRIVAAEYDEKYEMKSLYDYQWEYKTAVIFGEEGQSIDDEILQIVDDIVMIPMFGPIRSLNVGSSATVIFSHYASQHTPKVKS